MRTRDVMSSPVVTVAPDAYLKDVAATLVEHGINAAPDRVLCPCGCGALIAPEVVALATYQRLTPNQTGAIRVNSNVIQSR